MQGATFLCCVRITSTMTITLKGLDQCDWDNGKFAVCGSDEISGQGGIPLSRCLDRSVATVQTLF